MIRGIHHTAISTGDIDRLLGFYKDLFGFEEVFSSGWKTGTEMLDRITGLQNSSARVVMLKAGIAVVLDRNLGTFLFRNIISFHVFSGLQGTG